MVIDRIPLLTPHIQKGETAFAIDKEMIAKRTQAIMGLALAAFALLAGVVSQSPSELGMVTYLALTLIPASIIAIIVSGKIEKYDLEKSNQALDKKAVDHYMAKDRPAGAAMGYITGNQEAFKLLEKRANVDWSKVEEHLEDGEPDWFLLDYLADAGAPDDVIDTVLDRMSDEARQNYHDREAIDHYMAQDRPAGAAMEYIAKNPSALAMLIKRSDVNWDKVEEHIEGKDVDWVLADYLVQTGATDDAIIQFVVENMSVEARQAFQARRAPKYTSDVD